MNSAGSICTGTGCPFGHVYPEIQMLLRPKMERLRQVSEFFKTILEPVGGFSAARIQQNYC